MEFLIETLKNASLHIHAVWLAIACITVILAMAVAAGMMQVAAIKKQQQASQAQGYAEGKRDRLLPSHLVTPIIPFHVCTEYASGIFRWIFEK